MKLSTVQKRMKMYKLNHLQYPKVENYVIDESLSLQPLKNNFEFDKQVRNFKVKYNFDELNSFSFSLDGFLSMMLRLKGKIAVSLGESQAIVSAAQEFKALGFDITFLALNTDGSVNLEILKNKKFDYVFISGYVMDTFVITDLKKIKKLTKAKIIANVSACQEQMKQIDVALFDAYKLTGFQSHSVVLHNGILAEQHLSNYDYIGISMIYKALETLEFKCNYKKQFIKALEEELEGNMFFFVNNMLTLGNSLHFALKNIKAREIIRTLSLNKIFVTNGEGCSLGLSRPSKIIQAMGYTELESRQALSLSFSNELNNEDIQKIVKTISKKYRQIRALND